MCRTASEQEGDTEDSRDNLRKVPAVDPLAGMPELRHVEEEEVVVVAVKFMGFIFSY